jgi:hypothetical protein
MRLKNTSCSLYLPSLIKQDRSLWPHNASILIYPTLDTGLRISIGLPDADDIVQQVVAKLMQILVYVRRPVRTRRTIVR